MGKIAIGDILLGGDVDLVLDSGSTNSICNSAVTAALDTKFDNQNFVNHLYPVGSIYITYDDNNPSTFIGGQWELIGGQDSGMTYWPAFAIETDSAGTTVDESLPNISGDVGNSINYTSSKGAFKMYNIPGAQAQRDDNSYTVLFDASMGQVDENGQFIPQSASTYQNGAKVQVNSIKLFFWKKIDDASMIEAITPLEYSVVKDVLWSGSATGITTISLSGSMSDYDTIEFKVKSNDSTAFVVYNVETDQIVDDFIVPISWDASVNRFYLINNLNADKSSYTQNAGNCALLQVRGIKTTLIPSDRPYHSVKKLNPSVTWGFPSLQTDAGTELWEEVTGKHHTVRGSVKCVWSSGSQSAGQVLSICTLAGIPLPSAPSLSLGSIYNSATISDNCTSFLFTDGTLQEQTMAGWTNLAGWTMCININFEWDEA